MGDAHQAIAHIVADIRALVGVGLTAAEAELLTTEVRAALGAAAPNSRNFPTAKEPSMSEDNKADGLISDDEAHEIKQALIRGPAVAPSSSAESRAKDLVAAIEYLDSVTRRRRPAASETA